MHLPKDYNLPKRLVLAALVIILTVLAVHAVVPQWIVAVGSLLLLVLIFVWL